MIKKVDSYYMPDYFYAYIEILRVVGTLGFGYLAIVYFRNKGLLFVIFMSFAIALNPIIKVKLDRDAWQVLDVIMSLFTISSIFWDRYIDAKELDTL